jgi:hypothetical protein
MIHGPCWLQGIAYIAFDLHVTLQWWMPLIMADGDVGGGASVGSSSQADCLSRIVSMDDFIGSF